MGLVTQVFNEEAMATLHGNLAIGHTRYSTTGASHLRNAQPYVIETLHGPLGIAHNGNLTNAHILRRQLLERPLKGCPPEIILSTTNEHLVGNHLDQ